MSVTEFTLCVARLAFTLFRDEAFADDYPLPSDKIKLLLKKLDEDATSDGETLFVKGSPCKGKDEEMHAEHADHQHEWV